MKKMLQFFVMGFAIKIFATVPVIALAQDNVSTQQLLNYNPPLRGAPLSRIGAGTRGVTMANGFTLCAIAPDHTGLTTRAQPELNWFMSKATGPLEFSLVDSWTQHTVFQKQFTPQQNDGVHSFKLADFGVTLEPSVRYEWRIAMVAADDTLVSGKIRYIEPSLPLQTALEQADADEYAAIYARQGIWYDAIAALSRQIAENPRDLVLWQQRAALLEQVELPKAAAYDWRMALR